MAQNVSTSSALPLCKRLLSVEGSEDKYNDVIVCGAEKLATSRQHIIFFGGDVQVTLSHCDFQIFDYLCILPASLTNVRC